MKIKELLTDESKWCRGSFAKDINGMHLGWGNNPTACQWCLMGAVDHCYPPEEYYEMRLKIRDKLGYEYPTSWNDAPERKFEDVKKLVEELDI